MCFSSPLMVTVAPSFMRDAMSYIRVAFISEAGKELARASIDKSKAGAVFEIPFANPRKALAEKPGDEEALIEPHIALCRRSNQTTKDGLTCYVIPGYLETYFIKALD